MATDRFAVTTRDGSVAFVPIPPEDAQGSVLDRLYTAFLNSHDKIAFIHRLAPGKPS